MSIHSDIQTITGTAVGVTRQSEMLDCGAFNQITASLDATAVAGTNPTLDGTIEYSLGDDQWYVVATFTQITAAANETKVVTAPFGALLRFNEVIGGADTPTVTYTMKYILKG